MQRYLLALLFWPLAAIADDATIDEINRCMRANIPQTVRIQNFTITAWDRVGGQRTLKGKLYGTREKDRVRVMMRIEGPPDLAGAAYLVREGETADEMYLYLPAIQKVRRITGAALDGQLWGTDLSYNDVKQLQNAFAGSSASVEAAVAPYEGREVHALSFTPRAEDGTRYRSVRTLVDKKTCVALKVDFVEPAGIRKVMSVDPANLKQSGPHWYSSTAEIKDLKNGTRTRVVVTGVSAGDKLAGRYFVPQTFYLGN